MSYQDKKNENFSKYCHDGKIKLVQKWINDPNINVNWNYDSPLRRSIATNQIEIVKLLLTNSKIKTDYENRKEIKGTKLNSKANNGNSINMIFNPVTEAIITLNFEALDLLITLGNVKINRTEYLDVLLILENEKLNEYFMQLPNFMDYVIKQDTKYMSIISKDAADIFLF